MPPVAAAGAAVAAAVGATGVTAAAVVSGVVQGLIIGAVVGAASALISGGNVLEGALTGAALGAVGGGIGSAISSAAGGVASAGAAPIGGAGAGVSAAAPSAVASTEPIISTSFALKPGVAAMMPAATTTVAPTTSTAMGGLLSGVADTSAKVYAGIGKGLMQGIGSLGKQRMEEKAAEKEFERDKELLEFKDQLRETVPGEFQKKVVNVSVPAQWEEKTNWWDKHLHPERYNEAGILKGGAA